MKVTVHSAFGEGVNVYEHIYSIADLQQKVNDDLGVPPEYQVFTLADGQQLESITFENGEIVLDFEADLSGGASGSVRCYTEKFEFKCRTFCGVAEIDGHWNKVQCCCVHAQCNIL